MLDVQQINLALFVKMEKTRMFNKLNRNCQDYTSFVLVFDFM